VALNGRKLGRYAVLKDALTNWTELAGASSTTERYVREWLEQQAVSGIIAVENPAAAPPYRRYLLSYGYSEVLTDRASLWSFEPLHLSALFLLTYYRAKSILSHLKAWSYQKTAGAAENE